VVAAGVIGATDITAGAARPLGARPVMTLAGTSNVEVSPLDLLLAFILTTSLCPIRGTMLLCATLSKPTAHPPTLSVRQSTLLPRAKKLWSLLPLSATSSWLLSPTTISRSLSPALTTRNDDDDIESSDHDDQEEAQALAAHDDVIAASSVINDMLDTKHEQMQEAELKTEALKNKLQGLFDFSKELFITLPEYTKGTKFTFDISPVKLCDHLYDNTASPKQVYTVLSNTHIDYLVQLQRTMKELFDRLDFEPAHELQIIAYANFINNQVQNRTGSITSWINFVPWSKHAWLWSEFIAAPPDPPDPPGISEVSLDEAHAAFAATLPALTVSDTACAQVDAAAAAFADSVSDAINIASRAASALDATSKAQAFALNAASKAASALITTPPPPPLRRRPVLASTLGVLCPRVTPTFSTPPP
jgi:hypothetical protein